ncbi:SGNH hydrolase [Pilimelia anulata]|uniref:SGNH hydrolase n=1 Tax=Pilimelia anulata TaxID=53371 RepID=A0A8J3FDS7_9ACTN|nr:SGNH/GDSL hydrolase family protein [Pilimelia anulata]GGK05553.1 SGNH hydrolase [Pilimelia anulata]
MGRHTAKQRLRLRPRPFAYLALIGLAAALPWRPLTPVGVTAAAHGPLRIMPMGDSLTWGTGSRGGDGWRGPLYERLTAAGHHVDFVGPLRHGTGPDPDLAGYPGWRVDQLREQVPRLMAEHRPDIVLVHVGTNDLRRNDRLDTVAERLAALVGEIRANRPRTTVVLARLAPATERTVQRRITWYNNRITLLARQYDGAVADMTALDPRADLHDALHPNDHGYARMAARWAEAMAPALADRA